MLKSAINWAASRFGRSSAPPPEPVQIHDPAPARNEVIATSAGSDFVARSIAMFHFDIVHGCQLRCVGCPNSTLLPKVKQIAIADFDRCMKNVDVDYVHTLRLFNYGEPLLHQNLSGILEVLKHQRWRAEQVEISTNAQQVYWDDFEASIKSGVLTRIVVSCDGDGSPEQYEALRPPSKWDKFIHFLERTKELCDRHAPDMELMARSIVKTSGDMDNWRRVLEPRGWSSEFRGWKALPEAKENNTGREIEPVKGICTFVAPSDRFWGGLFHGQVNQLYVDWDGTVVPCCVHPRAGVLGNIREQTYNQILNGAQRRHFLETMEHARETLSVCGQCEYGPPEDPGMSFHNNAPAFEQAP